MLQDESNASDRRVTRRAAIQLGAAAGLAAVAAPYVVRTGASAVDHFDAEPTVFRNPNWPVPPIVTHTQWGANEGLRRSGRAYDSSISSLIVHHTGTPNDITDYAGLCRSILAYETSGEYIDIAYNWLIDPHGRIYEGRWAQGYGSGPHTGELNNLNVRGGHALYHNSRTIGIALMGTYDDINPSGAMIDSLVTLLAWKCARWGIDPMARSIYTSSIGRVESLWNICGHRDTYATDCPGSRTEPMLPTIRAKVAARLSGAGYWIASSAGQVLPFGAALPYGSATHVPPSGFSGMAGHPSGAGYWLHSRDGAVYSFGRSKFFGSMSGQRLNAPIVGMASTVTGNGYWLLGQDGGVFGFGDAKFYGSTGSLHLNAPVLGITPTRTGKGYWLYARDGGIFGYGDAKFYGSTGSIKLKRPVVAMAARPQGDGYWMIAEDGGIFGFGHAPFRGSGARDTTHSPCVSMLATTSGNGYVMLRRDGSLSAYGDAPNLGNGYGRVGAAAIGIAGRLKPR